MSSEKRRARYGVFSCLLALLAAAPFALLGCGAPSMYSLQPLAVDGGSPGYDNEVVLYLSKDLRDYQFYQYEYKSAIGQILTPNITELVRRVFPNVVVVEDKEALDQVIGQKTILIPKIKSAFRDETGASTTWSDCRTRVVLAWELRGVDKEVAWQSEFSGESVTNQGNLFTRKKNIQRSVKEASERAIQASYDGIKSAREIAEYFSKM